TAPLASTTVPSMTAVVICDWAATPDPAAASQTITTVNTRRDRMRRPPFAEYRFLHTFVKPACSATRRERAGGIAAQPVRSSAILDLPTSPSRASSYKDVALL